MSNNVKYGKKLVKNILFVPFWGKTVKTFPKFRVQMTTYYILIYSNSVAYYILDLVIIKKGAK